jgi:hypothetical protein
MLVRIINIESSTNEKAGLIISTLQLNPKEALIIHMDVKVKRIKLII